MTLNEFIEKYQGKKIDFDGGYGAQCMDLYRYYVKEVLNFPQSPTIIGAYQVFETANKYSFTKIQKTFWGMPQAGDIIVWGTGFGGFGHIAVVVNANIWSVKVFEQNNPVNNPCRVWDHNYRYVIGWLRPKTALLSLTQKEMQPIFKMAGIATLYFNVGNILVPFAADFPTYQIDFNDNPIIELTPGEFTKFKIATGVKVVKA